MPPSSASSKAIAGARITTAVFFLLFGEYKLAGPGFAHGGFQGYLRGYIDGAAVSFYRPVLAHLVLPHAVLLGYMVGLLEIFIGLSLLLGLWVRLASVLGALFMLNLTLSTWWEPGHGAPLLALLRSRARYSPAAVAFYHFLRH
jgi:uncharacterized membrane protein YphA (DoxX/SURF4 family)